MGIAKDALMQAQAQLWERIDALAASLPQLSISRLAHEIDELRRWCECHPRFGSERVHRLLLGTEPGAYTQFTVILPREPAGNPGG